MIIVVQVRQMRRERDPEHRAREAEIADLQKKLIEQRKKNKVCTQKKLQIK